MNVVCLLSGGLDSTTVLAKLLREGHRVRCLSVVYGQKHVREVEAAKAVASHYGVEHEVVELPPSLLKGSALTGGGPIPEGHYADLSMRQTVVPARNTVLLSIAAAVAVREGCDAVAYGAHRGDRSVYPDCRPTFVYAMETVLLRCDYEPINLIVPYLDRDKSGIVAEGLRLGVPFEKTVTCYKGGERHCGRCGSCVERREAFTKNGVTDPVQYEGG